MFAPPWESPSQPFRETLSHIGCADAEALTVYFLTKQLNADAWVHGPHRFFTEREHASCSACRIVDLSNNASARERRAIIDEQQIDDETDHLAGCEVLARRLIGDFRETPDQVFKEVSHGQVRDRAGSQVDLGKTIEHLPQQGCFLEPLQLIGEQKLVEEYVSDRRRELGDVVHKIVVKLGGVLPLELCESECAVIIDPHAFA